MPPRRSAPDAATRHRALPSGWRRRDGLEAVVLALFGVELVYLSDFVQKVPWQADVGWVALGAVALAAPLAWRRRFPVTVMVAVSFLYFTLATWVGVEMYASQVVLFLGFYSVGAWCPDRRLAVRSRAAVAVGMAVWLLWATVDQFTDPQVGERGVNAYMAFAAIQLLVNIAYFTGAWIFGDRTWHAAVERENLEAAHAEIREQQDRLAEQAVSLERLRIARELHDVVAHHVTAMGVQAGAARVSMTRDPDAAAVHLRGVESSAREAVAELKTMVHTLRDGDEVPDSVPRLADLDALVADARAIGQDAVLERIGPEPDLPPPAQLALYRTAQEGITNARKHAGPRAAVTVRLRSGTDRVELEVSDNGRGGRPGDTPAHGTGMGVTGMRERMASMGGTLQAGPKPDGGWLVRATVPVPSGERTLP
ncbi:sensor histidine kinase [Kocuria tytonicola]|uniref:histidine kinase n=1 Tax=Kocuria tytonicola TaxID=2055946 RepID=A0A3L9L055_9MICC|nr:sensor histidine kinase [Kocuria tytonicola]RLY92313.1 sensor histidine kinase [Kocuria tytonicola]